jgi:hypothetical protein
MEGRGMTSERTINQVRAILSKLDRSIDEAREKRRQVPGATAHHTGGGAGVTANQGIASPASSRPAPSQVATPAPAAAATKPATPTSAFGRAQPIRSSTATNLLRFNSN